MDPNGGNIKDYHLFLKNAFKKLIFLFNILIVVLHKIIKTNIIELENLVGEHELSGLDTFIERSSQSYYRDDASGYRFILDGITYRVVEDPSDGYRSHLSELEVVSEKVDYTFPPQKVVGKMRENGPWSTNDIIEFYDLITNKPVLTIGTDNSDDWYPFCVMEWSPENLSVNQA